MLGNDATHRGDNNMTQQEWTRLFTGQNSPVVVLPKAERLSAEPRFARIFQAVEPLPMTETFRKRLGAAMSPPSLARMLELI
jgi:hypothetical protein